MEAVYVEGDGNCLYGALALMVFSDEGRHQELRRNIQEYVRENPTRYLEFRFDNLEEYLEEMKMMGRDREYCVDNQLAAASRMLNLDLMVVAYVYERGEYYRQIPNTGHSCTKVLFGLSPGRDSTITLHDQTEDIKLKCDQQWTDSTTCTRVCSPFVWVSFPKCYRWNSASTYAFRYCFCAQACLTLGH